MLFRGCVWEWGGGGGVVGVQHSKCPKLEKQGVKIHKCALLLNFPPSFWLYHMHL